MSEMLLHKTVGVKLT